MGDALYRQMDAPDVWTRFKSDAPTYIMGTGFVFSFAISVLLWISFSFVGIRYSGFLVFLYAIFCSFFL